MYTQKQVLVLNNPQWLICQLYGYKYSFLMSVIIWFQVLFLFVYPELCIYTVIHRQTFSLYHNYSVWLDTPDVSSWDQNSR